MASVDILDIRRAQLVAEIVDLALAVVADDDLLLAGVVHVGEECDHIAHGVLHIAEHGVEIGINLLIKVDMALLLAYQYLARAQTAVGYALNLADYAQHGGDLQLALV